MNKAKAISLSLVVCSAIALHAEEVVLDTISVEANMGAEIIKNVSGEDIKSADLGEALAKQSPSVSFNRRSGISNDITVRGQRKDNINVTIDGVKIYGACPNRMDPPISHILTNNVDFIEINEGPFNVEDFGVLSADVKVHTVKPEEGFQGEVDLGLGSFGYKKGAFTVTGGSKEVRFLLSGSREAGSQYEDGNGDDFVGQIANNIANGTIPATAQYQSVFQDRDAFSKQTLMAKLFWDIADNQELRLSYTLNRSQDILYPSTPMDAIWDDSNIYNIEYIAKDLGIYSKELSFQAYQSDVEHPMSTQYRLSGATNYMTHTLTTKTQGAKIKNSVEIDNHTLTMGLDTSTRNWDGNYYKNDVLIAKPHSIWDVETQNMAFFLQDSIKMDALTLDMGLRYDDTQITSGNIAQPSNDYSGVNGYIVASYRPNETTKYFTGVGKSSRVPDAKELYFMNSMGISIGTPTLNETLNYEFDIGVEKQYENAMVKAKFFYSQLKDYIAYNASNGTLNNYENVDASVYGFDLSGSWIATEALSFDYGFAYQKGTKDAPLKGQTGTNMPDISPLKMNLALNYEWDSSLALKAEVIGADGWNTFDAENGEQKIDAYTVLNLKATQKFGKVLEITVGVDNVFDSTYAVSNTYKDLTLLSVAGGDVMLLNEAGRYYYTNIKYKF